jgi:hypothetical protein
LRSNAIAGSITNTSTSANIVTGGSFTASHDTSLGVANISVLGALTYGASSSGNVTINSGLYVSVPTYNGASTVALTTLSGINVANQGNSKVSNSYGILIEAQSGSTNSYGIGVSGSTGKSFIQGQLIVGDTTTASSSEMAVEGDISVSGELLGARELLTCGYNPAASTGDYLRMANGVPMSSTKGFVFNRAGSIVGFSVDFDIATETTPGTIDFNIKVNDVTVITVTSTTSGTGDYTEDFTQARNTDTFSASDRLQVEFVFNTFVGTIDNISAMIEIAIDT